MDSLELLSKQIQSYEENNRSEHSRLYEKMDEILTVTQAVTTEISSHKKQLNSLEKGQEEIKDSIDAMDKRVKGLEDHQLKRDHSWNMFLKWSGAVATIGAITTVVLKILGVF